MKKHKLFINLHDIKLPWSVSFSRRDNKPLVRLKTIVNFPLTYWPNGKPCILVNSWLQHISTISTGIETASTYAYHISHCIRFCYKKEIELQNLDDPLLEELRDFLRNEILTSNGINYRARRDNQIRYTIKRLLDFLKWYQDNYHISTDSNIIGEAGSGAKITIELKNDTHGHSSMHHLSIPQREPPVGDKHPMPDSYIGQIISTILKKNKLIDISTIEETGKSDAERKNIRSRYFYERRMITIKLMEICGLRPDEMNRIPLEMNQDPLHTRRLFIPTLKTRSKTPPIREFPISLEQAIEIKRYLNSRCEFINSCRIQKTSLGSNQFLLGVDGKAINTRSLARDFKRIVNLSGLADVKVCLSMFRHRFITMRITFEIRKEISIGLSQKDLWQEAVQRKILTKVSKLTGHRNPMSLIDYFHEAHALQLSPPHSETNNQRSETILILRKTLEELKGTEAISTNKDIADKIILLDESLKNLEQHD